MPTLVWVCSDRCGGRVRTCPQSSAGRPPLLLRPRAVPRTATAGPPPLSTPAQPWVLLGVELDTHALSLLTAWTANILNIGILTFFFEEVKEEVPPLPTCPQQCTCYP